MSLSSIKASAVYKKQDGTISLSKDRRTIYWTPTAPAGGSPTLKISASDLSNLQQSPATSAKASLKVIVHPPGATSPENYVFTFTSPTAARAELASILDPLKEVIAAAKAGVGPATPNATPEVGQSAAMAIAQAVSAGTRGSDDEIHTDAQLLEDSALWKSLIDSNPVLRQRFLDAVKDKPASITMPQFTRQFWSSRIHLLRAHAVEKTQQQGAHNVLSEVKTKNVDGSTKLSLSREQIQLIFNQHPLVRRVYNDLVPKSYSESGFWADFFVSQLFKKLKGEKITEHDPEVPKVDKYINFDEDADQTRQFIIEHVPRFIDLEGNDQNHSQRKGNAPDWTMKPNFQGKVPILHVLNNMSEKMMVNVAPSDAEAHAPVGMDEETFNELRLRDLQRLDEDNRVLLSISDQQHFFSKDQANGQSVNRKLDSGKVLKAVRRDVRSQNDLPTELEEDDQRQAGDATKGIMRSVKQRVSHMSPGSDSETSLSSTIVDSATMTHNTTVEFLHYFWSVYLSGDGTRADELSKLVETLEKSLERIEAVAVLAEKDRTEQLAKLHKDQEEFLQRTGRKRRLDMSKVSGGRKAVENMLAATIRAVRYAREEYKRAYREQSSLQSLEGS